ncbi:MAG: sodium:proton antiporter [Rhizobiales bacterium]|nr:sodium:proton antiporter [Hyphomicrobiales bacterium]MBA69310.1 sodium:proton antiporter [Hyphomicrobiales bacterium]
MTVTKEQILDKLRSVRGPDLETDIVSLGIVSDIFIADGKAYFSLTVPAEKAQELEPMRMAAEKAALQVEGVKSAMVALTAAREGGSEPAHSAPPQRPAPGGRGHSHGGAPGQGGGGRAKVEIPGVAKIIAVASGKGGVGKSTTAVNIALGLKTLGLKVGLLDADIYGPSVPRLTGVSGRPEQLEGRVLKPKENYGLKIMSIGFLVEEETPMIWRGPMVMSALTQMLREVAWGELDVLVVDMPPGTGDAQLTMAQQVPLAGAVIVSTPQDLALLDARKGVNMFKRVNVPILGIVENMSHFVCPDCGSRHDIFGHGGARAEAERIGVPFLGEVPLAMPIRESSDAGKPVVACEPDGPHAKAYIAIADGVKAGLETAASQAKPAPTIVFE